MKRKTYRLSSERIDRYAAYLREQERADHTVEKYVRSLRALGRWLDGRELTKAALVEWKGALSEIYAPASVNSMLAAVNSFLTFMDWRELAVRPLRIQRAIFRDEGRELTRKEYARLVAAAQREGCERLGLVMQTICATGIRVSELRFITVQAVRTGRAEVSCKGKRRVVFLPEKLRRALGRYLAKQPYTAGAVFVTRTGRPLDRSNIWREMKQLCRRAGVEPGKVFPHNLRHLFARTYYTREKDLSRLADLLGHTSVATTRIYTAESGEVHARQLERLDLVLTT